MIAQEIYILNARGTTGGHDFMRRQELIYAAEAIGLSLESIAYVHSFYCLCIHFKLFLLIVNEFGLSCWSFETIFNFLRPEKGKGKPGQFGSSPKDWYSGFSSMKTLITKGLVVKSSCPAKYDFHFPSLFFTF